MHIKNTENHPHGWELTDIDATPPRTFAVGLSEIVAHNAARAMNKLIALGYVEAGHVQSLVAAMSELQRQAQASDILLIKYMGHVRDCEGVDYTDNLNAGGPCEQTFYPDEVTRLQFYSRGGA